MKQRNKAMVVQGVVFPPGPGAARSQGEKLWSYMFSLRPWKLGGSDLRKTELRVAKQVDDDELKHLRGAVESYEVVSIRARFDHGRTDTASLLEILRDVPPDETLINEALELRKPVTRLDLQFGALTLDRGLGSWSSEVEWCERRVQLTLYSGDGDLDAPLETARTLWTQKDAWHQRIREFAIDELLSLKNSNWLEDGELAVTGAEFAKRIQLESISVYQDARFEFFYGDDDLFWGHSILIAGNLREGPMSATLAG